MKTIKMLAKQYNISYQGMNKKVRNQLHDQLKGHVFKENGITVIDEDGELIIRQSLERNNHIYEDLVCLETKNIEKKPKDMKLKNKKIKLIDETHETHETHEIIKLKEKERFNNETMKLKEEIIEDYKQRIEEYKEEIKIKNGQLKELSNQNTLLIEKVGNSQTLLGMNMLPKTDESINNTEEHDSRTESSQAKIKWFDRIFKRS